MTFVDLWLLVIVIFLGTMWPLGHLNRRFDADIEAEDRYKARELARGTIGGDLARSGFILMGRYRTLGSAKLNRSGDSLRALMIIRILLFVGWLMLFSHVIDPVHVPD